MRYTRYYSGPLDMQPVQLQAWHQPGNKHQLNPNTSYLVAHCTSLADHDVQSPTWFFVLWVL